MKAIFSILGRKIAKVTILHIRYPIWDQLRKKFKTSKQEGAKSMFLGRGVNTQNAARRNNVPHQSGKNEEQMTAPDHKEAHKLLILEVQALNISIFV